MRTGARGSEVTTCPLLSHDCAAQPVVSRRSARRGAQGGGDSECDGPGKRRRIRITVVCHLRRMLARRKRW